MEGINESIKAYSITGSLSTLVASAFPSGSNISTKPSKQLLSFLREMTLFRSMHSKSTFDNSIDYISQQLITLVKTCFSSDQDIDRKILRISLFILSDLICSYHYAPNSQIKKHVEVLYSTIFDEITKQKTLGTLIATFKSSICWKYVYCFALENSSEIRSFFEFTCQTFQSLSYPKKQQKSILNVSSAKKEREFDSQVQLWCNVTLTLRKLMLSNYSLPGGCLANIEAALISPVKMLSIHAINILFQVITTQELSFVKDAVRVLHKFSKQSENIARLREDSLFSVVYLKCLAALGDNDNFPIDDLKTLYLNALNIFFENSSSIPVKIFADAIKYFLCHKRSPALMIQTPLTFAALINQRLEINTLDTSNLALDLPMLLRSIIVLGKFNQRMHILPTDTTKLTFQSLRKVLSLLYDQRLDNYHLVLLTIQSMIWIHEIPASKEVNATILNFLCDQGDEDAAKRLLDEAFDRVVAVSDRSHVPIIIHVSSLINLQSLAQQIASYCPSYTLVQILDRIWQVVSLCILDSREVDVNSEKSRCCKSLIASFRECLSKIADWEFRHEKFEIRSNLPKLTREFQWLALWHFVENSNVWLYELVGLQYMCRDLAINVPDATVQSLNITFTRTSNSLNGVLHRILRLSSPLVKARLLCQMINKIKSLELKGEQPELAEAGARVTDLCFNTLLLMHQDCCDKFLEIELRCIIIEFINSKDEVAGQQTLKEKSGRWNFLLKEELIFSERVDHFESSKATPTKDPPKASSVDSSIAYSLDFMEKLSISPVAPQINENVQENTNAFALPEYFTRNLNTSNSMSYLDNFLNATSETPIRNTDTPLNLNILNDLSSSMAYSSQFPQPMLPFGLGKISDSSKEESLPVTAADDIYLIAFQNEFNKGGSSLGDLTNMQNEKKSESLDDMLMTSSISGVSSSTSSIPTENKPERRKSIAKIALPPPTKPPISRKSRLN